MPCIVIELPRSQVLVEWHLVGLRFKAHWSLDSSRAPTKEIPSLIAKPRKNHKMGHVKGGGTQVADFSKGKIRGTHPNIFAPPLGKT